MPKQDHGMNKETTIKLFSDQKIRTHWDEEQEKWYFSIADVVSVLSESVNPQAYWRKLKQRLRAEGNETVTNCHGLKMIAPDGKMRLTDEITVGNKSVSLMLLIMYLKLLKVLAQGLQPIRWQQGKELRVTIPLELKV